jgi:hypothetical protein
MFIGKSNSYNTAPLVAFLSIAAMSADIALADDPKTALEAVKYRRYDDPISSGDVYKIPEVVLASASDEVKADGCKTGANQTLVKAKLIDAGDTKCPNGIVPNLFTIVIPGVVETVQGDLVTVSYEVKDGAGAKKTISLPKNLISKRQGIVPGSELIIYPEITGFKKGADVIKGFNIFAKQMNADPHRIDSTTKFSVQLK